MSADAAEPLKGRPTEEAEEGEGGRVIHTCNIET